MLEQDSQNRAAKLSSCRQSAPTPAEREELVGYAQRHGVANFCRVLFNLNEFSFVD